MWCDASMERAYIAMQGIAELEVSWDMYHGLDDGVGLGEKNSIGYSVLCERIVDFTGIAEECPYTIAHYFQAFDCIFNSPCIHT